MKSLGVHVVFLLSSVVSMFCICGLISALQHWQAVGRWSVVEFMSYLDKLYNVGAFTYLQ